jgi:hypothetical protein
MVEAKCPACASHEFYARDAEDGFEVYDFEIIEGEVVFSASEETLQVTGLEEDTEAHCSRCSWHGSLAALMKGKS